MIFFQLFTTAFMSIFYGVVITAAVMATIVLLMICCMSLLVCWIIVHDAVAYSWSV